MTAHVSETQSPSVPLEGSASTSVPPAATIPPANGMRAGKILIEATKPLAVESRARSWYVLFSTLLIVALLTAVGAVAPYWWVRLAAAVINGLTIVRLFIVYHDYMHGAILKNSPVAKAILSVYGVLVLTPPKVWKDTHNYHHAHTAKIIGSNVGSYLMVTTEMWKTMSATQRRYYKAIRHPLTITFGYFTVFMLGMCLSPTLRDPKKNWQAGFALALNWILSALIIWKFGFAVFAFAFLIPLMVATAAGGYLFYAQHNFPDIYVQPRESWNYTRAALESSSYMKMGPIMHWFTGNIGYHHVHHLNPQIPFYRLPEAMAQIPELQNPHSTSLAPKDIAACFAQKLWDVQNKKMVGYPRD